MNQSPAKSGKLCCCGAGRTCNVDVSWGGVEGGWSPCPAAVAGRDAYDRKTMLRWQSTPLNTRKGTDLVFYTWYWLLVMVLKPTE